MNRHTAKAIIEASPRRTLVIRFVNLDGVQEIKASGRRLAPKERRAEDRPPQAPARKRRETPQEDAPPKKDRPWEDLEQANREMEALFNTFTL